MLLLSRIMLSRPSPISPFKAVVAFAALTLAAAHAEAGRAWPASRDLGPQIVAAKEVDGVNRDFGADGVDAEQALRIDSVSTEAAVHDRLASSDAELSPLPANHEFDAAATGEVRGKLLLQAMADLPQVGASANRSSLFLDFWDDASSARSAVDDRASGTVDAAQANARSGGVHSNVMIPLPMAAWSALSVFGGVGFVTGMRRVARRFFE
jgi:hypothetical protein